MNVIFQSSPWWVLVCLLVGALYAAALYQPLPARLSTGVSDSVSFWDRNVRYALAAVRFLVVSLLCFLLVNPLIRSVQTLTEKPKVVLAVDNSESVAAAGRPALTTALSNLQALQQQLSSAGLDVSVRTLSDSAMTEGTDLTQIPFTQRSTNLSGLLSGIRSDYEGRHLTDVVLISDGIFNQGLSPTFGQYPFSVHAVGLGDTIPKRDIAIKGIVANRIAYLNNQFPIQVEVTSNGFSGRAGIVVLRQGGKEVGRQSVSFGQNQTFGSVTFQTTATQKGVQRFTVEVVPQPGEFSTRNNRQDVYIDVIDGREKVLLLALAPHPDVKAIRSMLERNQNYELDVRMINGIEGPPPTDKKYDLIILHQIPDNGGASTASVQQLLARNNTTPVLFVLGNQSAMGPFNTLNPVMQVTALPGQSDKVTARYNDAYKQLNLDAARLDIITKMPPMSVPYGEFRLLPGSQVVLWQQVGSVQTQKPLLALNVTAGSPDRPRKAAVLAGEGLWQWRMEEFDLTDKQEVIDEMLQKVIQLISVKEDRRKLRVYPIRNEFVAGEKVIFETELYNDIYERIYDKPVNLSILDERGITRSFNYTPTSDNSRFEISRLPEGAYRFRATTNLSGKNEVSEGQFIVRDLQLEALNTTADHGLLRQLASQTGGKFYNTASVANLVRDLSSRETPARLSSTEELNELINWRWLFFMILALATLEWGTRKYFGGY
ncbi:VWA domain-containing protein [Rudanella paleaurantiibacter]|uniref:VWA domain-containing protein n=1 Tax=Rudanella paleaurantiibacter TaxID=2614655 RepID=A0A7J5TYX8_9BACT|nr:VWA domain-containing protein [Rudanella paleaurantiibacter]KAB7730348.1 VWA domain-containing protein [Rudanella paleaurantiibacter]